MSRSTAQTAKPLSSKSRECRPLPAARSSTRPPYLISGMNRLTQAEAAPEDIGSSAIIDTTGIELGRLDGSVYNCPRGGCLDDPVYVGLCLWPRARATA